MLHFFATRKDGVNRSSKPIVWRLGSGNVHPPMKSLPEVNKAGASTPEEQEHINAMDNLKEIIGQKKLTPTHEVILHSQYGKGISVVTDELLASKDLPRDPSGRLIISGDGLFTTKDNVLLLNKSGDAHAIVIKSPLAVGIVVGSWRCIKKGILPLMLEHFLNLQSDPKDIKIVIGPGLGADSYDLSEENYQEILKENPLFSAAFTPKSLKNQDAPIPKHIPAAAMSSKVEIASEPEKTQNALTKPPKYILNFVELIKIFAKDLQIEVVENETATTFNRAQWRQVKAQAKEQKDPKLLMEYYQNQLYFSARLYTKVDKNIRKIVAANKLEIPAGIEQPKSTYDGTGRCLNGVVKR